MIFDRLQKEFEVARASQTEGHIAILVFSSINILWNHENYFLSDRSCTFYLLCSSWRSNFRLLFVCSSVFDGSTKHTNLTLAPLL